MRGEHRRRGDGSPPAWSAPLGARPTQSFWRGCPHPAAPAPSPTPAKAGRLEGVWVEESSEVERSSQKNWGCDWGCHLKGRSGSQSLRGILCEAPLGDLLSGDGQITCGSQWVPR